MSKIPFVIIIMVFFSKTSFKVYPHMYNARTQQTPIELQKPAIDI